MIIERSTNNPLILMKVVKRIACLFALIFAVTFANAQNGEIKEDEKAFLETEEVTEETIDTTALKEYFSFQLRADSIIKALHFDSVGVMSP